MRVEAAPFLGGALSSISPPRALACTVLYCCFESGLWADMLALEWALGVLLATFVGGAL